ncbi:hypothetical protein SDC9_125002 [bioreactor metagenome]|uniref:Uncharacterized protein n=1 Tax=bioreactor metagenome TaxID=1076179 RepID=A0A645CMJ5_9ZZZZ
MNRFRLASVKFCHASGFDDRLITSALKSKIKRGMSNGFLFGKCPVHTGSADRNRNRYIDIILRYIADFVKDVEFLIGNRGKVAFIYDKYISVAFDLAEYSVKPGCPLLQEDRNFSGDGAIIVLMVSGSFRVVIDSDIADDRVLRTKLFLACDQLGLVLPYSQIIKLLI